VSQVDLSALRIDEADPVVPKRPLGQRWLLGIVLVLALALAATFLWPLLVPPRGVRMAAVRTAGHTAAASSAAATTEAVGWVEADPFPIIVRPLVSGHIETLEVLEGDRVTAGETVVARLASAELLAARDRAVAGVAESEAHLALARASQDLAQQRREQNAEALLRLAEARTQQLMTETRLETARARARLATAQAASAAANVKAQERLEAAGQSYPVALERARADADAAAANVAASTEEVAGLAQELEERRATVELCRELAARPVDLEGAEAVAGAETAQAEAVLARARTELEIAERELEWATVRAPRDGVVMRLEAEPGDMVGHGEKGIVALYDPERLRARIDVPLDSIQGIHPGQEVEITSEAIGDVVVQGVVQRLQHETDLLKNTLQVKIGLTDPPALLRPETLCRARFLAAAAEPGTTPEVTAFRVPAAAVQDGVVFVLDPKSGRARAIPVDVVGQEGDDRVVRGELSPTQRVVLEPVTDGEAIRELSQ